MTIHKMVSVICSGLFAVAAYGQDLMIPTGTIIPVALNSSISPENSMRGQAISARVMQDVPLPNGSKIPEGANITGGVVEVHRATEGIPATISFTFRNYESKAGVIPVTTNLRAVASFVEVEAAQIPTTDVDTWGSRTTVQVGGDVVYWGGGPVVGPTGPVGEPVLGTSGVLVTPAASSGSECRGEFGENQNKQATWVFSADACGVYGLSGTTISKAGWSEPVGVAELTLSGNRTIPRGTAMLLRVMGPERVGAVQTPAETPPANPVTAGLQ